MSKLLGFNYTVQWIAGKNHMIAEVVVKKTVSMAENHDDIIICKVADVAKLITQAEADKDYQRVVDALKEGTHVRHLNSLHPAQKYHSQWNEMAVYEGD